MDTSFFSRRGVSIVTVITMLASQFGSIGLNMAYAAAPTVTVVVTDTAMQVGETSLVTFTFSEAVSGFDNSDLTIAGGSLDPVATGDNITWTATFTPTNGIEAPTNAITVNLAGVTDVGLIPGVGTTDSNNYAIDTVAPTVTLTTGAPNPTNGAFIVTATFSEAVTGVLDADFTVANGSKSGFNASSATVYTVLVTPTTDGVVTIDMAGSAAIDAASNNSIVATQLSRTYDSTAPTVAITDDEAGTANIAGGDVVYTFTFSEAVTGFDTTDVTVVGGAKGVFTPVSPTVYTLVVTPTASSVADITVDIAGSAAIDAASNNSIVATQSVQAVDTVAPTVVIGATPTSVNSGATSSLTFTLSEPSVNFTSGDVTVAGGTLSAFAGSGTGYTATFTPTPSSTTNGTVDVAGGVFTDAAGNDNTAATQNVISVDTLAPTVVLSTAAPNPTNSSSFTVTATFSEAVTGMLDADFVVVNGTKSAFTAVSPTVYTVLVTPVVDGAVTIDMTGGAAIDAASNTSAVATQLSRTYDSTNPSVVLSTSAPNPLNGAFTVTATFSEAVTGMALGDFVLSSNAGKTAFNALSSTGYTILVTPTADGVVTIDLPVAAAQDLATNNNSAATQLTRTYDFTPPTIVITTSTGQVNSGSTVALTFTLSESSVNFTSGDVTVAGGTLSAFAGSGTGYTATFTPTPSSTTTGTIDVAGGVFTDAATNGNTAATQKIISVDTVDPTITIGATPASVNSGATSALTFTLSEPSVNFTSGDVTVVGGTLSAFAGSGTGYTATFTPTPSSTTTGTIDVAGGVFTDAFGNNNVVATQNVISVDTIVPTVVLSTSAPSPTNTGFSVTATFSEPVTGVTLGDFAIGNGTASAFTSVSSTVYTIFVTPTVDGMVSVDLPAAIAQDSFLNDNVSATGITRTYDATAPVVTVTGSGTLIVAHGSAYVDAGATWIDALDGTGTLISANSGSVNTSILGTYTLQYWKIDAAGNTGTTVTRTVTVTDQTAPVVTLVGSAGITLAYNSLYTDSGASWTDAIDGTGNTLSGTYGNTGTFQSSGSVNTALPGTYTITYKKVDAAGNVGSVTRTIVVNQNISNGGSAGGGGSYTPIVSPTSTGTQSVVIAPPKVTVNILLSSNPNITQDTFVKKISDIRRSHVTIITTTTLARGTLVYIFKILPNGKEIKIGKTRVLSNGKIRFVVNTAGKFHIVQK